MRLSCGTFIERTVPVTLWCLILAAANAFEERLATPCQAQPIGSALSTGQRFTLATPDGRNRSRALLVRGTLRVTDEAGATTIYDRAPRYDTADGQFVGYLSQTIGRVIRWPLSGQGNMQLADLTDPRPQFRSSRQLVSPDNGGIRGTGSLMNPPLTNGPLGPLGTQPGLASGNAFASFQPLTINIPVQDVGPITGQQGRLTTADGMQAGLVLDVDINGVVQMNLPGATASQYWTVIPVTADVVRLQFFRGGQLWSLAATNPAGPAVAEVTRRDPLQLWRAVGAGGAMRLDSVAYPGRSLAGGADGLVQLERTSGAAAQQWLGSFAPPPPSIVLPTVRLIQHEYRPNPPLPPARLRMVNSHRNELNVVIADLRDNRRRPTVTIPAGGSTIVELPRDSGGALIERYEVQTATGLIASEQTVTPIPAAVWFDVSVYEKFLQSIAIDRTGKSPNVIEDINYQPKSVGYFVLPAGDQLPDGSTIDVYRQAQANQNPGGVRALTPSRGESVPKDPLERTLEELGLPRR